MVLSTTSENPLPELVKSWGPVNWNASTPPRLTVKLFSVYGPWPGAWLISMPMKKVLPPISVRIWSTVYVGDTVTWGDVGLTGSTVNPNPAGLLHEGLPITQGLFSVCWNTALSGVSAMGSAPAVSGRPASIRTVSPINDSTRLMAPSFLSFWLAAGNHPAWSVPFVGQAAESTWKRGLGAHRSTFKERSGICSGKLHAPSGKNPGQESPGASATLFTRLTFTCFTLVPS